MQITHSVTRLLDHQTIEYLTCATISGPLHQVSYFYHDPHHYPMPYLSPAHPPRQENVILHTDKDKYKTNKMSQIQIQTLPNQ
jgi:hypothetical protein